MDLLKILSQDALIPRKVGTGTIYEWRAKKGDISGQIFFLNKDLIAVKIQSCSGFNFYSCIELQPVKHFYIIF